MGSKGLNQRKLSAPQKFRKKGKAEALTAWFISQLGYIKRSISGKTIILFRVNGLHAQDLPKLVREVQIRDAKLKSASIFFEHWEDTENGGLFWNMPGYALFECNRMELKEMVQRFWFEDEQQCEIFFVQRDQLHVAYNWQREFGPAYRPGRILPFVEAIVDNKEQGFESIIFAKS